MSIIDRYLILSKADWGHLFSNRKFTTSSYIGIFIGTLLCIVNGSPFFLKEGNLIPSLYSFLIFFTLAISAIGIYFKRFYFIPFSIILFNALYIAANLYWTFQEGKPINPVTVSYSVMYFIINAIMFRLSAVFIINLSVFIVIFICSLYSFYMKDAAGIALHQPFLVNAVFLSAAGFLLQHLVLTVRAMLIEQLGSIKLQVVALKAEMELENARKDAREKAIQLNRISIVEALGASIAHEINQPISAALTYCRAARNWSAIECGEAPETLQAISGVESNVDRAARLIDNIRLLTTNKGRTYLLTDVREVVKDQLDLVQPEFERRGISISFAPASTETNAMVCRSEVALATINLLRNAMEAFEGVGGKAVVEVDCRRTSHGWVEVLVIDNGKGLSPEGIQRAFGAFQSTKTSGVGIGLSICQEVAEHHSGSISLAANSYGGVTATLRLATEPHGV